MSTLYHQFAAFTISGLTVGAIYAVLAVGYTIVYRILGLFNFAHGGVLMVGTFVALWVARGLALGESPGTGAIIGASVLMFLAAAAAGVLLSVAIEFSIFRPIRVRRGGGLPALVAGLGAITMIQEIFGLWQGRSPVAVPQPIGTTPVFTVFGGHVTARELAVFIAAAVALVALDRYVALARNGRALRAVGQDARTAALMGINVQRVIVLSFVIAGATAGLAATLSNLNYGNTSYFVGFSLGIKGFTAALLGGMGSVPGAMVGGLVLGVAESYGGAIFGAQWQDVIAFGALIFILVTRPRGIVGERMAMVRA
jgi:branched-chain amino acid transport system permease protein